MGNSNSFECVLEICANVCLISDTFLLCNFFYTNIQHPLKINNNITFNFILYFLGWLNTYDDPNYYQHFHDCLSHRFAFLKLSIFNWAVCSLLKTDNKQIKTNLYKSQSRRVMKRKLFQLFFQQYVTQWTISDLSVLAKRWVFLNPFISITQVCQCFFLYTFFIWITVSNLVF